MLTHYSSLQGLLEHDQYAIDQNARAGHDLLNKILYAFQLASANGPLCSEPLQGVAVFLEELSLSTQADANETAIEASGRLTGEIIRTVRDFIRQGFLDWSPRMLLAMYSCEIQASSKPSLPSLLQ